MNLSPCELENLLTQQDAASRIRLEDWSNTLWPHVRADRISLAMRNLQHRRFEHRVIRGALAFLIIFVLFLLYADPIRPPSTAGVGFFAYVLMGLIVEAIWKNVRLIAGERRAREWLVNMGDIRALPGLLRGIERGKPRHGDAISLLNNGTMDELPAAMLPGEQRELCQLVRRFLAGHSKHLHAQTSEVEADLLIAMLRFLAARQPQECEILLRRVVARTVPQGNAAFVGEAAQSLLNNETVRPTAATVLRVGVR